MTTTAHKTASETASNSTTSSAPHSVSHGASNGASHGASNGAAHGSTSSAQACCQGANDVFKAGIEANQKMFNAVSSAFSKMMSASSTMWTGTPAAEGFAGFPMTPAVMQNMQNMKTMNPFANAPAIFDVMTKCMNGVIDANARIATECNAMMIDAARTNARTFERTGEMVINQINSQMNNQFGAFTGSTPTAQHTANKSAKPVVDTAREIFDEAYAFANKTGERVIKMNTEHVQQISKVMNDTFTCATSLTGTQVSSKSCCNA